MQVNNTYVTIEFGGNKNKIYYIWLRDNCRCAKCYSTFFNQRLIHIFDVPLNIKPSTCEIANDSLVITWEDGHRSEYSLEWLHNFKFERNEKIERFLWDKGILNTIQDITVSSDVYFRDVNGIKILIGNILKYGFAIVSGIEQTVEATEKVVHRFADTQKTCFGEMWHVRTSSTCNDTSTTSLGLLPHNDNTFFTNPAGLQVFHLLNHSGFGGETILVDGFNIANIIKSKNPEAFKILCSVPVEAHFIDKNHHFVCSEPIIKLHPATEEYDKIRFNIYDRTPLISVEDDDTLKLYEALFLFGKEVSDSKNQGLFKLQPGNVIFIDNWRVLHGRTKFSGDRHLTGCYVSRDDFVSAIKRLHPQF